MISRTVASTSAETSRLVARKAGETRARNRDRTGRAGSPFARSSQARCAGTRRCLPRRAPRSARRASMHSTSSRIVPPPANTSSTMPAGVLRRTEADGQQGQHLGRLAAVDAGRLGRRARGRNGARCGAARCAGAAGRARPPRRSRFMVRTKRWAAGWNCRSPTFSTASWTCAETMSRSWSSSATSLREVMRRRFQRLPVRERRPAPRPSATLLQVHAERAKPPCQGRRAALRSSSC